MYTHPLFFLLLFFVSTYTPTHTDACIPCFVHFSLTSILPSHEKYFLSVSSSKFPPFPPHTFSPLAVSRVLALDLYNHLRDTCSTQCLASHKRLALERRQSVADTRERKEDAGDKEGRGAIDAGQEDDDGHDAVSGGARVVGRDLADEVVEGGRGRADAEEERDFDEENHKGEAPVCVCVTRD